MARYLTRDAAAVAVAVLGPLALAAVLLPWRGSWPNTNVALLLVVAVVAVPAWGTAWPARSRRYRPRSGSTTSSPGRTNGSPSAIPPT